MLENPQPQLSLKHISKAFGLHDKRVEVIQDLDLDVYNGEFISIFGPNGCGKSTLLHLIAGITKADSGQIDFHSDGNSEKLVGMVFQDYEKSLMPWRTCLDNICLPLESESSLSKKERRSRAILVLEHLGIRLPLESYPYQMSGGQKQLSCIARAMVRQPSLLLLDEPFASLDYQTRINMQDTIQDIWGRTKVTTIFISHEIDEAIYLADRVLLLTSRPAKVAGWFEVALSRPRELGMLSTPVFIETRAQILDRFRSEVMR